MNNKSCPFCGEKHMLKLDIHQTEQGFFEGWVECMNCGARGQTEYGSCLPDEMENLVWYGWNERVDDKNKSN